MKKRNIVVTYGEIERMTRVYSSYKIDKEIHTIQKTSERSREEASQQFFDLLIHEPMVSSVEFNGITFVNTELQDRYFQTRSVDLSFSDCTFMGEVTFQDFDQLYFHQCDFLESKYMRPGEFHILSNRMIFEQCQGRNRVDMDLMGLEDICLLHSDFHYVTSTWRLQTPLLCLNDSAIFCDDLDYHVERLEQGPMESTIRAFDVNYFDIPIGNTMKADLLSFVTSKDHSVARLAEQYRLMEITQFLNYYGQRLAREVHRSDETNLLCRNLQQVKSSDLKSVFQMMNQLGEVPSMEELKNLTPVQLVKRMQRVE